MQHTKTKKQDLTKIGEAISRELGAKMVKDFQDANPEEAIGNYIGRDILEKILAQPGCMGVRFYNAINETGRKTLVYVGIDENNQIIEKYPCINSAGELFIDDGTVADRAGAPDPEDSWSWV